MDPNSGERRIRRKKKGIDELKYLAVALAALTVGIFIGRNSNPSQITLQMANTAGYYAQTVQTVLTQANVNRSMPELTSQSIMETQDLNVVLVTSSLAQESMIPETSAVTDAEEQTESTTAVSDSGSTTSAEAVIMTEKTTAPPDTTGAVSTTITTTAVPTTVPTTAATTKATTAATKQGKVNINTANAAQLDTLPGIGEAKARSIIEYRKANGPFRSIEDLINVSGIGEKTMDKLRPLITIGE